MATKATETEFNLVRVSPESVTVWIIGRTPLIHNRLAEKARRELLLPRGRLTAADKAGNLKHDPLSEFRSSIHHDGKRLTLPSSMVKGAICRAALDTEGTRKTEVGRLTWVESPDPTLYGVPQLLMSPVRSADMNKTPDIRTRAIFPAWCAEVTVSFIRPRMTERNVVTLLHNAGFTCGVGDWRQEKGNGNYGSFELTSDLSLVESIINAGGWEQQLAAMENPAFYNAESQELFDWFSLEAVRREKNLESKQSKAKVKGNGAHPVPGSEAVSEEGHPLNG